MAYDAIAIVTEGLSKTGGGYSAALIVTEGFSDTAGPAVAVVAGMHWITRWYYRLVRIRKKKKRRR